LSDWSCRDDLRLVECFILLLQQVNAPFGMVVLAVEKQCLISIAWGSGEPNIYWNHLIREEIITFCSRGRVMLFNATFNNIAVISWGSVILVEEARVLGENHQLVANHWQTLSHNVVSSTPRHERDSNLQR
jgi:hypothetical protein